MEPDLSQERLQAHALLDMLSLEKLTAVRSLLEVMVEPLSRSLALAAVGEEEITPETAEAAGPRPSFAGARRRHSARRDPARIRPRQMNEDTAPGRIAVIWSADARADLRAMDRETAIQILTAWTATWPAVSAT
jgi:hypothetical protein